MTCDADTTPVPPPTIERNVQVRAHDGHGWVTFGEFRDLDDARGAIRILTQARKVDGRPHWATIQTRCLKRGQCLESWVQSLGFYSQVVP